jgi:hypothetical protein
MNIPIKLGSNWPSDFREEDYKQATPFLTPLFLLCNTDNQKTLLNYKSTIP